jgi:hypothetical protein
MYETLIHQWFAPLLVDGSVEVLSNPIEMFHLGMPLLVVKVYYNI